MLELVDVHTYYGESYILQGTSLEVKDGSVVALLGRNGMGKTTTIRTIMGFAPLRYGVINFRGRDISNLETYRIAQMGIGLVPQGRLIFPSLTVMENLTMAARGGEKEGAWDLNRVYSIFPVLKERANYTGTLLSGGEQQMLTIARALMTNPRLLLMDEPSEGLAPIVVQEIGRIIKELKDSGFSILLVEQNLPMALAVTGYVYVISKGIIVYESPSEKLLDDEEIVSKFLGVTYDKSLSN
jgi:branched-chain amino acid transport system ATP-binding protein